MTLSFQHSEQDYLVYLLYVATKTGRAKKRLNFSRWIVTAVYLVLGILGLLNAKLLIGITFIIIAIVWYGITPWRLRKSYIKNYRSFIRKNLEKQLNHQVEIQFNDGQIEEIVDTSRTIHEAADFSEMVVLRSHYLLFNSNVSGLIIPKHVIPDEALFLKTIRGYEIEIREDLKWDEEYFI